MGVVRGDFERVVQTTRAPEAAVRSTAVPDIGAPLLFAENAMRSWAQLWGKLAEMGSDYTMRKNRAEHDMRVQNSNEASAMAEYMSFSDETRTRYEELDGMFSGRRADSIQEEERSSYDEWEKMRGSGVGRAYSNLQAARMNSALARDRWNRTGFFGWLGTPHVGTSIR